MLRPMPERDPAPPIGDVLPTVDGKFFFVGAQKLYMRSVSYGPFAQAKHGFPSLVQPVMTHLAPQGSEQHSRLQLVHSATPHMHSPASLYS